MKCCSRRLRRIALVIDADKYFALIEDNIGGKANPFKVKNCNQKEKKQFRDHRVAVNANGGR